MGPEVGEEFPNFVANTQVGEIEMHSYCTGSWLMFFSHPADMTPICTTEFGMVSKLQDEFDARNCKVLGLSADSVESHEAWIKDINETQETDVRFPIIADENSEISRTLGICNKNGEIVTRTLFLVDPNRKVQLKMMYPTNIGRNFYETIRCLDALQLTEYNGSIGTPANWKNGEDVVILPHVSDEKASELFQSFTTIKPYLRIAPAPDLQLEEKR